jgi:hypothetical protein
VGLGCTYSAAQHLILVTPIALDKVLVLVVILQQPILLTPTAICRISADILCRMAGDWLWQISVC